MGLYPRNAENRALVGEIEANALASFGTPAEIIAFANAVGRLLDNPVIITVKNIARLTVCPVFCSVARMPEAAPLFSLGTEFMIEAVLELQTSLLRGP